ncbi:MAG: hypothetical protein WDM80_06135 [Limisphaerales bacterium]
MANVLAGRTGLKEPDGPDITAGYNPNRRKKPADPTAGRLETVSEPLTFVTDDNGSQECKLVEYCTSNARTALTGDDKTELPRCSEPVRSR